MNTMKKSSLIGAVSAFALVAGLAASPALARIGDCDTCNIHWSFDPGFIHIDADPTFIDLDALTRICANQTYFGNQFDLAVAGDVWAKSFDNTATAIANVVSVNGGTKDGVTLPSVVPAVVEVSQKAAGELTAIAVGYDAYIGGDFTNSATAAANIASISSTNVGVLSGEQVAGSKFYGPDLDLASAAVAGDVKVWGGDFSNTATSVANVASLEVTVDPSLKPSWFHHDDVLALVDLNQFANTDQTAFSAIRDVHVWGSNGTGNVTNSASSIVNAVSVTLDSSLNKSVVGSVQADVTQTAFSNLSAVSLASKVGASGAFTNSATTAANVINVINK